MTLKAGQDLHIIACPRGEVIDPKKRTPLYVYGVRWAARPDLGFPPRGFDVRRQIGSTQKKIGTFFLPRSKTWTVFRADAEARRPALGPYFTTILRDNLAYLLPIVRLADPRTPATELRSLTKKVADFFGETHREDPALAWTFWGTSTPPELDALLAATATRAALISFYRARATTYLLALALRFEYAVLFGLATDDSFAPERGAISYVVAARWGKEAGTSSTTLDRKKSCVPAPPRVLTAERVPGSVAHPAFSAWPNWTPPRELSPTDSDGEPLPAAALIPRSPAAFTALSWTEAPASGRLIDYGAVLYRLGRFHFGVESAGGQATPPLPAGAVFARLFDGEPQMRPASPPHTIDLPGMAWPPLEGHYVYEVHSVNLLGFSSAGGTRAAIRHHDDLPPAAPRVRLPNGPTLTIDDEGNAGAELAVDWDSSEDFVSPDVVEFRVAAQFSPLLAIAVDVLELLSATPLVCTVRVASIGGAANRYAGLRLMLPNGEFVIVEHGTSAPTTMKVRRSGGRAPAVGVTGTILAPEPPTPALRVARTARLVPSPAVVTEVTSLSPVEIRLAPSAPINSSRLYLHLLRATVDAERVDDRFRLTPPPNASPGADAWARWLALPDPAAAMAGSPAIAFPPHQLTVTASVPAGFAAGAMLLQITAADDADYVASPPIAGASTALANLKGNESSSAEVLLSVRSSAPPPSPNVDPFDPSTRLWATSAASYAETARFDLGWSAVAGAVRYEVWRALEGNIVGANAATTPTELRALAGAQPAAFELRTAAAFGTHHLDELPGRAPTRALYRVRAVSAGGVPGDFSPLIGPVDVPDVRPPPAPNLLRVAAVAPAVQDRALAIEWTQAALAADVRFDVEARDVGAPEFELVASVPAGTAPVNGRFRFVHAGRSPGRPLEYRVFAIREALDPIDPGGAAKRDIRSAPSAVRAGVAVSAAPLASPTALAATHAAAGAVRVSWTNADEYQSVLVYRRAPDRFGFELLAELPGSAESHDDITVITGTWAYQVRARGYSREARTDTVAVVVP